MKLSSQLETCKQLRSIHQPPAEDERLGIALGSLSTLPLNALRHQPNSGTCGWYIWGGDYSDDPDFFQSLHVYHIAKYAPQLVKYLALAPGWRVLLAPGQTDAWYDPNLISR